MMLKVSNYRNGHHIASFARSRATLDAMTDRGFCTVTCQEGKLYFSPEQWVAELTEEEAEAFGAVEEYSILEFEDEEAFLYYDSKAMDNALFITNRCNSNCIMCPVSSKMRSHSPVAKIENLLNICSQIPSDAPHITITGGEPFLLKEDIFRLFAYLKERLNDVEYLLLTNGRALSDKAYFHKFVQTLPDNTLVGVPLHGYDADSHDYITRSPGSFNQTMKALKNLLSTHIRIEIRIVVSRLNLSYLDRIAELIIHQLKGVYTIKFIGLEMLGNARLNMEDVWIDYRKSFRYMEKPIRNLIVHGFNVGIYNYPLCCVTKGFWPICEKSITDYKVRFLPECDICTKKDACGGLFSGTFRLMEGIVEPIQ